MVSVNIFGKSNFRKKNSHPYSFINVRKILFYLLLLLPSFLIAQQVQLFNQFNGRYDFTAFGNTLNFEENGGGGTCDIQTQSSAALSLNPGETLVSAHLYWAGSGSGDFNVTLNGGNVTAQRTFGLNFNGLDFFAAYADVSLLVGINGDGVYTLSDLDLLADIPPYCNGGTNFGGWSIIVIYEDPTLTLNQISLFDGLEFVSAANPQLEIVLDNIDIEMKNYHIPKYQIYFYKPNEYEPEKVDSYSLENLGQMNQLKIDITHIISDYSTYNQYKNYNINDFIFYIISPN